jgi:UDP-N-acetylmuramyl pentapeptide synthase
MFVAIAGSNADGHDYIDEAHTQGAGHAGRRFLR